MAPFALQWATIQKSKKMGLAYYDLWGVQGTSKKEQWKGFSTFKHRFSPETKTTSYLPMHIVIIKKWQYFLFQVIRAIKNRFF